MELAALSKLYSRSIVVYVEAGGKVEEKTFLCSAEEGRTTSDKLNNPVRTIYEDLPFVYPHHTHTHILLFNLGGGGGGCARACIGVCISVIGSQ